MIGTNSRRNVAFMMSVFFGSLAASSGQAQGIDVGGEIVKALQQAINHRPSRMEVGPSIIVVDPKTLTAVATFTNPSKDTMDADISVKLLPPGMRQKPSSPKSALLANDSTTERTASPNETRWSLVPWITKSPKTIRVAPGKTDSITIALQAPDSTSPGEYSAWIIATTTVSGSFTSTNSSTGVTVEISGQDNAPRRVWSAARIVHTVSVAK